jgi:hypothetical protein
MMNYKLDYFRGWKDACIDVAKFLDEMADNLPDEVDFLADSLRNIAKSVTVKGETAIAIAEQKLKGSEQ